MKRPMHSLPIFVRLDGQPVILNGEGEMADAKRRLLERAGGRIVGEDDGDARIAFVAGDAPDAVAARLKARGLLVNVADRPDLCDFTLGAIIDRSPVIVAVGTGGASAGLAAALRQRLETLLPASLGALAERLAKEKMGLTSAQRRAAVAEAFGESVDAATRTETLVLASPDPDDLTLRQARLLANAARVYHAADVPAAILDRARADAARLPGLAPADPGEGVTLDIRMSA